MSEAHQTADKHVFETLPQTVVKLLDGADLSSKTGFVISLITVDDAGYSHTSLLGVGELLVLDASIVRFALWPRSRAARHLQRAPQLTMSFVFDAAFYQLQLKARPLTIHNALQVGSASVAAGVPGEPAAIPPLSYFQAELVRGEAQRVQYAQLTSGIEFKLAGDIDGELARWQLQVEALKHAGPSR